MTTPRLARAVYVVLLAAIAHAAPGDDSIQITIGLSPRLSGVFFSFGARSGTHCLIEHHDDTVILSNIRNNYDVSIVAEQF